MLKYLVVIVGPTAIGKTNLAITLAEEFNTEILSADSRQFFCEMSIGTAKPNPTELSVAKHHFINSHSIVEDFNVGDFETHGLKLLEEIFQERDIAILVGGSGLYIKAITNGFDDLPKNDPEIRKQLNLEYQEKGLPHLQQKLKLLDPVYYSEVDINNPQRIIRSLEICLLTDKPFSSLRKKNQKKRPFKTIKIGLTADRNLLYERINTRVDAMINAGLIEEVKSLSSYKHLNALQTVGYREVFEYLEGKTRREDAVNKIKQNSRNFAKRQLTWFRKDQEITWFDIERVNHIPDFIKEKLNIKPVQ